MAVKIPTNKSKVDATRALQRVISRAAIDAGIDEHAMAIYMTHFLEQLSEELAFGEPVKIPGFALFSPCLQDRSKKGRRSRMVVKCLVSGSLNRKVAESAPHSPKGKQAYDQYLRNHGYHNITKSTNRVSHLRNGRNSNPRTDKGNRLPIMERMRQSFQRDALEQGKELMTCVRKK